VRKMQCKLLQVSPRLCFLRRASGGGPGWARLRLRLRLRWSSLYCVCRQTATLVTSRPGGVGAVQARLGSDGGWSKGQTRGRHSDERRQGRLLLQVGKWAMGSAVFRRGDGEAEDDTAVVGSKGFLNRLCSCFCPTPAAPHMRARPQTRPSHPRRPAATIHGQGSWQSEKRSVAGVRLWSAGKLERKPNRPRTGMALPRFATLPAWPRCRPRPTAAQVLVGCVPAAASERTIMYSRPAATAARALLLLCTYTQVAVVDPNAPSAAPCMRPTRPARLVAHSTMVPCWRSP
jgi:hypothetical protein